MRFIVDYYGPRQVVSLFRLGDSNLVVLCIEFNICRMILVGRGEAILFHAAMKKIVDITTIT